MKSRRCVQLTCQMWPLYLGKSGKVTKCGRFFGHSVLAVLLVLVWRVCIPGALGHSSPEEVSTDSHAEFAAR